MPTGCCLRPLFHSLFTHDCAAKYQNNHIIKYVNDTAVAGVINDNKHVNWLETTDC